MQLRNNSPAGGGWRFDLHRSAFGFLWLFIFCVPWEEELLTSAHLPISHIVGTGAALLGILACLARGRIRRPQPMHYIAVALVGWAALSYLWSIAPDLTAVRVGSYLQLLFMVWLMWEFANSPGRQLSLLAAYVLGTWVAALSTIHSFVTGTGANLGLVEGRYTAANMNENELGIVLALGMVMASYLLAIGKRPLFLWFVSVPVFFASILLTGSRGSFLASTIALLLFPLSLRRLSLTSRVLAGAALLVAIVAAPVLLPAATWDRVRTIPAEISGGSLTKRTYIWSAGLDAYTQRPFAGVGAGAFEASVYKQLDIAYVAHNSYLSVLVELGAVGLILFALLLGSLWLAAFELPPTARISWVFLLLTWSVAVSSVTWEHRKPTWFLFGLLMAQSASLAKNGMAGVRSFRPLKHRQTRVPATTLPVFNAQGL